MPYSYTISKAKLLFLLALTSLLPSCKTCCDSPSTIEETYNIPKGVKESLAYEHMIHEVEGIVFNMLNSLHERDKGEIETHADYNVFAGRGECATQQLDTDLNLLVLNYSDGCTDDFQKFRSGSIEISYTDPLDQIGNTLQVTLDNYRFSGLGLEGQIRIENISQTNSNDAKSYSISFTNLELSINGEISLHTGNRSVEYIKEDGSQYETTTLEYRTTNNIEFEISGGQVFSFETASTHINNFDCWLNQQFLPKRGTSLLKSPNQDIEIDYDTGLCDYSLYIQVGNEEPKAFDLAVIL